jgi:hypothetical protein
MGANKPIEDIEATLLAATKSALRGAFAPTEEILHPPFSPAKPNEKALGPAAHESLPDVHCRAKLISSKLDLRRAVRPCQTFFSANGSLNPADLFEQSTTARIGEYEFAIEWGRVQCQILVDVESDDYWLRQRTEAHQRMVAIDLYALPLTGAVRIAGRRPDAIIKNADGIVVRDTRRERIDRRNDLARRAAVHLTDLVANSILRSYSAALDDPDNELIHLYEIRDALSSQFRGERAAQMALNISSTKWRRLGSLANVEPLLQGRHRGGNPGALRDATADELEDARWIAREMIESYLQSLKAP